jgi:hypothetical protein
MTLPEAQQLAKFHELREKAPRYRDCGVGRELWIAAHAYQMGADAELESCCDWLDGTTVVSPSCQATRLRAARRPKPPTLKEQALAAARIELDANGKNGALIIRALEALPE